VLTACSGGGGSQGTVPTNQQSLASTARAATISSVGRSTSDHADCPNENGGRHEESGARARLDHDGQSDGGDGEHGNGSCCPTSTGTTGTTAGGGSEGRLGTRERDRSGDEERPSPCPSPTPTPLVVTPTALAIDCMYSKVATLTVAGTPAGLTAVVADPRQASVGAPTIVNGNTTFVVTGLGTLPTTIALADTAGATASVTVTLTRCPWRR
jgi:hypothetical protein